MNHRASERSSPASRRHFSGEHNVELIAQSYSSLHARRTEGSLWLGREENPRRYSRQKASDVQELQARARCGGEAMIDYPDAIRYEVRAWLS